MQAERTNLVICKLGLLKLKDEAAKAKQALDEVEEQA